MKSIRRNFLNMPLLRDNLQPTDFADADCRITDWHDFTGTLGEDAYRIWMCKCGSHWFQRHEWRYTGRNFTDMQEWIYSGYSPRRTWDNHFKEAPPT